MAIFPALQKLTHIVLHVSCRTRTSGGYFRPSEVRFRAKIPLSSHRFYNVNIAKGTTDPGVDCFNQIEKLKNQATSPQETFSLSHHTNSRYIAVTTCTECPSTFLVSSARAESVKF